MHVQGRLKQEQLMHIHVDLTLHVAPLQKLLYISEIYVRILFSLMAIKERLVTLK